MREGRAEAVALATYLNDHLAGSVAALTLLDQLAALAQGTDLARFCRELGTEIETDRAELLALMARLRVGESRPRKVAAWVGEKVTELKLRLDDATGGSFRVLETLEAVSLGIEGKRALWRALAAASDGRSDADYARLERRAAEQRARVEIVRLDVARTALGALHRA